MSNKSYKLKLAPSSQLYLRTKSHLKSRLKLPRLSPRFFQNPRNKSVLSQLKSVITASLRTKTTLRKSTEALSARRHRSTKRDFTMAFRQSFQVSSQITESKL